MDGSSWRGLRAKQKAYREIHRQNKQLSSDLIPELQQEVSVLGSLKSLRVSFWSCLIKSESLIVDLGSNECLLFLATLEA